MLALIYTAFGALLVGNGVVFLLGYSGVSATRNEDFAKFQVMFLMANCLVLLADWLQGPYLYRLYAHYGYPKVCENKLCLCLGVSVGCREGC